MNANQLGEDEIRKRLESHLVPYEELAQNDYNAFTEKRAQLVKKLADRLCDGQIVEGLL